MSDNRKDKDVNTTIIIIVVSGIVLIVVALYFSNFCFRYDLCPFAEKDAWGQLGDYVGGILNPVVSAFALYLAAKAYDSQRKDLKETQATQEKQVKLAALTALINAKLMQINSLHTNYPILIKRKNDKDLSLRNAGAVGVKQEKKESQKKVINDLENEINSLPDKVIAL